MSIIRPSYVLNNTIPTADFPLRIGVTPALWLDGADSSTLISDGAASFASASSQSLSITDAASSQTLRSGDSVYMSCWVRNLGAGSQALIDKCYSNGGTYLNEYRLLIGGGGQTASFMMVDSTDTIRTATNSTQSVGVSAYAHVGAWHDGQNIYISVNNNTPASVGCVGSRKSTNPFSLGGGTGTVPGNYLTGYIDSAVFCKNVNVSFTDLNTYLYNSGNGRRSSDFKSSSYYLNGNPSGAVSWWDLDETSGTRKDRIGTNDLTASASSPTYASGIASGLVQYDGDPVKQWLDKSGYAQHFTASSDAARPTYKIGLQNGKSGVRLDGTDDLMTAGSTIANLRTIAMVVRYNNATVIKSYGGYFSPTSGAASEFILAGAAGSTSFYDITPADMVYYKNGTLTNEISANAGPMNAYTVCVFSGPTAWATYTYQIGMDRNQGSGRMIHADYCEIIVLQTELTANQRNQLTRYLGNKWGITVA